MAVVETSEHAALAERARMNGRNVVEQALAELPDDPANNERREYLMNWQRILASPPIRSNLDPVHLIREDRDR